MKIEVRFTAVSPLPNTAVSYAFRTRIVLLKEGTYKAVASIDYKIENGAVVASSGNTGSTTRLLLEATAVGGGLCLDTTTLKSGFAQHVTWGFSLVGQFPNKDHTVTVDGHKGQFGCESGASSVDVPKEKIKELELNRVRVFVQEDPDQDQITQNHVKVEYRIIDCKYLPRTK